MGTRTALQKCIFESDAKLLINVYTGICGISYFDIIFEDCVEFYKHFDKVLIEYVHKPVNSVVHVLARTAYFKSDLRNGLLLLS